jgi:GC-rich sequence DNA-binding factor
VQRARAKQMEDELALFHGVPELSLLPPVPLRADAEPDEVAEAEPSPGDDGDAMSDTRAARREQPTLDDLRPEDQAAFAKAWQGITTRLDELLSDVQAPEYRSPAAQVERHGTLVPHPASLVSRFSDWRTRYADEYAGAWGGLALSGAWEFWVRREMGAWDALRCAAGGASGPQGLDAFEWHAQLGAYAEAQPEPSGGDEEAVGNVVSTVVVPLLVARAVELAEQVGYVLERDGWRFQVSPPWPLRGAQLTFSSQSLVAAHIAPFRTHIAALQASLDSAVLYPAPGFHPLSPPARLSFVRRLVGLLRHLGRWNRYVGPGERPAYAQTVDTLLDRLIWPLLQQSSDTGGKDTAKEVSAASGSTVAAADRLCTQVMSAVPPTLLPTELRTRLLAYVGS